MSFLRSGVTWWIFLGVEWTTACPAKTISPGKTISGMNISLIIPFVRDSETVEKVFYKKCCILAYFGTRHDGMVQKRTHVTTLVEK